MKLDKTGIDHLKRLEAWRAYPYFDQRGKPTIGWGFTWYPDTGKAVTMEDPPLTPEFGEDMLRAVLVRFEAVVCAQVVQRLTQNQFNALVSFAYNVGPANFSSSSLLRIVNRDPCDYPAITAQFRRWNKTRIAGVLTVSNGLIYRREQEIKMYCNGSPS